MRPVAWPFQDVPSASASGDSSSSPNSIKNRFASSWDAKQEGSDRDYLYNLGASANYNTNVDVGQSIEMGLDSHFVGNFLGLKSDIADGSLRNYEFRKFDNIVGDYYVSPRFLEKIAIHFVKNYLIELGAISDKVRVPLILGIWGPKGMGKTFQTELAFKKMGVEAVVMSAGELEHEWAGTPGKLIRERYRKASEMSKVRGKMTCLMINDIDAGLGHFANTQVTVNNQIVIGTLMSICDDPNRVSIGQDWLDGDLGLIRRTPIVVTGNDFSKMFAPLIRDGRMEKFYFKPTNEELVAILWEMYKDDGLAVEDIVQLIKRFENQPLDFFGALRSSHYDSQIRTWIQDEAGFDITADNSNLAELGKRLARKENLPVFEPAVLTLQDLIDEGERLEREQQMVLDHKLSKEYLKDTGSSGQLIGMMGDG